MSMSLIVYYFLHKCFNRSFYLNGNAIWSLSSSQINTNFVLFTTPRSYYPNNESTDEEKELHKRWHKTNNVAICYIMRIMSQILQL